MNKYQCYVVWTGREIGILQSWEQVQASTNGFSNAKHMGFNTHFDATEAFKGTYEEALSNKNRPDESTSYSMDDFM